MGKVSTEARRRYKANGKARAAAREREEAGEAPEGELDPELWQMRKVLGQGKAGDRGPRQKFYRGLLDADPFKFMKMVHEREGALRKTAGPSVRKDEGLERSLGLAEALLKEITKERV